MAIPTAYLTTVKNLHGILNAIQGAQAPEKFTQKFLESLEFKSNTDRLVINLLKAIRFLDDGGRPTKRYFAYLDQSQGGKVLAEGIREAYADLFKVNVNAHRMSNTEVVNKLKTLSEGKISEAVAKKMSMTFLALVKQADFSGPPATDASTKDETRPDTTRQAATDTETVEPIRPGLPIGGLVYNIQIMLPESRDPAVYDAIFRSLRSHIG